MKLKANKRLNLVKLTLISLTAFLLLIIGFSFRTLTRNQSVNFSPSPVLPQNNENWKNYSNQNFNFSISYPSTWHTQGPKSDFDGTIVYLFSDDQGWSSSVEAIGYYVFIYKAFELPQAQYKTKFVNEYKAYTTESLPSRMGSLSYFIEAGNNTYLAVNFTPYNSQNPYPNQEKFKEVFDQILSSFRFLDKICAPGEHLTYCKRGKCCCPVGALCD